MIAVQLAGCFAVHSNAPANLGLVPCRTMAPLLAHLKPCSVDGENQVYYRWSSGGAGCTLVTADAAADDESLGHSQLRHWLAQSGELVLKGSFGL